MKARSQNLFVKLAKQNCYLLLLLLIVISKDVLNAQTTSVQNVNFTATNQSVFGPGTATSFHQKYNLFKDNNIETSKFISGGVNGVLTLDKDATNIINTAIDVVNAAITTANITAEPDIPLASKRSSYKFGGSFDVKAGIDFDAYMEILVQGAAANINYPANFTIKYPNNLSFGCGDSFYISVNAERAATGSSLSILDPEFEFKIGSMLKAGIYGGAQFCFGGCSPHGSIDYGEPSFSNASSGDYKQYLKGGEYDLFKISSSTGISFPWDLNAGISNPTSIPSLTLPLTTSSLGDFEDKTKIKASIYNPFTNLSGANSFSGNTITNSSTTDFFNIQFDPIKLTEAITRIPLQFSANLGDGVSVNFDAVSLPITLDAKQLNNFSVIPSGFTVDLNLGRTLQWEERNITQTITGYNTINDASGIPHQVPITRNDTVFVRSGNSSFVSGFKEGNILKIKNYPDTAATSITPVFKMSSNFSTQISENLNLYVDLKLAEGQFNFPSFNLSSILNGLVSTLNIDGDFKQTFIDAIDKISNISSSGIISFGPYPNPTPRLELANFQIPILNKNFALDGVSEVNGTAIKLRPDNVPPIIQTINDKYFAISNETLTLGPRDVVRTATDVNGGAIDYISLVPNTFTCSDIGHTIPVQVTIGDHRCNQVTQTTNIKIYDNAGPIARCKTTPITLYLNSTGTTNTLLVSDIDNGSTGNCLSNKSLSLSTFNCNHLGSNVVGLSMRDVVSRTSNCTSTVIVKDTIRPTAVCKKKVTDILITTNGTATVSESYIDSSLTKDNCFFPLTKTISPTVLYCSNVGLNTVSMTVTDSAKNTSKCTATVNVIDNTSPTFTCPSNLTISACAATKVYFPNPSISDNCSSSLIIQQTGGIASNSNFPLGTTTNSFNLKDKLGTVLSTCSFTVKLQNSGPPQIICPPNTTLTTNVNSSCRYSFAPFGPVTTSPCGYELSLSLEEGIIPGNEVPYGTTKSVFKVTDQIGNTATCSFTYTVIDPIKPDINCPASITVNADIGSCSKIVNYNNPTGSDNCFGTSGLTFTRISGFSSGSSFPKGTTIVSYELSDFPGNKDTCSFNVTVNDLNSPPVIVCPMNISVTTDAASCDAILNYSTPIGTDNCSEVSTIQTSGLESGSSFPIGLTNNTFKVTDDNGQSSTCSFIVTVKDEQVPEITCPENFVVVCHSTEGINNRQVNYELPTATDNCNVTLTRISGPESGSEFPEGLTHIVYKATDDAGWSATCEFTVELNGCNRAPVAQCVSALTIADGNCQSIVIPTDVNSNSYDPDHDDLTMNLFPAGPYSLGDHILTLHVTDPSGLTDECNLVLTVIDNSAPIVPILPIVHLGQCSGIPQAPKALDNCSGTITGTTTTIFPIETQGSIFVNWTFDDGHGKVSTGVQEFIISDTEAPISPSLTDINIGECSGTPPTPAAIDNCSGIVEGTSNISFPITTQGLTVVTWTFEDEHGNISHANQNVFLKDDIAPTLPILQDLEFELSSYTPAVPIAHDNCYGDISGLTTTTFPITKEGTSIVVWTFDDGHGNVSSASQRITLNDITPPISPILEDVIVGECSGSPSIPTTTDNVAGQIFGTTTTSFPITKQGVTVVNWTFDDGNGNSITVPQNVIVDDVTPPVAPVLQDISLKVCQNISSIPIALDNCVGNVIGKTNTIFPITIPGNYVVIWSFDDGNGNVITANQNVIVIIPNEPGKYLNLNTCEMTICPPGTYCPGATTEPIYCPAGKYQNLTGQTQCASCPAGSYSSVTGSISCASCPAGKYQGQVGQTSCISCPPGYFSSVSGSISCNGCPVQTYNPIPGATSCLNCPAKTYNPNIAATICPDCTVGITCGANISVNTDAGSCIAGSVDLTSPTIVNSCPIAHLDNNAPDDFSIGSTIVKWTVTDVSGVSATCNQIVNVNKFGDPTSLYGYTILSNDEIKLKENIIESGGIGVISNNKKISLEQNTKVIASNTFVRSSNIDIKSGSEATTKIYSVVPTSIKPEFLENKNPSNNDVKINDNSNPVTLILSSYGKIEIGKNVLATFSGKGTVYIKELILEDGSQLIFNQATQIMINDKLDSGDNIKINNAAQPGIQFYVEDEVKLSKGSIVKANIYTKKQIKIEKSTASSRTYMTGQFIADKIDAAEFVNWNWNPDFCPKDVQSLPSIHSIENIESVPNLQEIDANQTGEDQLKVYPNPANNMFYIQLVEKGRVKVSIRLLNSIGKEMMNEFIDVNPNKLQIISVNVLPFPSGLYFLEVLQGDKKQIKAITIIK